MNRLSVERPGRLAGPFHADYQQMQQSCPYASSFLIFSSITS